MVPVIGGKVEERQQCFAILDQAFDGPRKLAVIMQWKLRKLELKAGHPSRRGGRQKGSAAAYSNKSGRDSERETIANAEDEYRRFVATWKQQSPKGRSGATKEVRRS
jgi:hypothetical protein